jgi:hypothetical protein
LGVEGRLVEVGAGEEAETVDVDREGEGEGEDDDDDELPLPLTHSVRYLPEESKGYSWRGRPGRGPLVPEGAPAGFPEPPLQAPRKRRVMMPKLKRQKMRRGEE